MIRHQEITDRDLHSKIKNGEICYGGNSSLKIFGTLTCGSGRKMKKENRVFFVSEKEAVQNGYRPCGHCRKVEYQKWKDGII